MTKYETTVVSAVASFVTRLNDGPTALLFASYVAVLARKTTKTKHLEVLDLLEKMHTSLSQTLAEKQNDAT